MGLGNHHPVDNTTMNPRMYIFANRSLGMSPGKLAAQVAHAAVEAYRISADNLIEAWYEGKHYTKLVMLGRDTEHMQITDIYLKDRGFKTAPIIDEGRTEIKPHSFTALGVGIVDKDNPHVEASFSSFQVYKEEKKPAQKKRYPWGGHYDLP